MNKILDVTIKQLFSNVQKITTPGRQDPGKFQRTERVEISKSK